MHTIKYHDKKLSKKYIKNAIIGMIALKEAGKR